MQLSNNKFEIWDIWEKSRSDSTADRRPHSLQHPPTLSDAVILTIRHRKQTCPLIIVIFWRNKAFSQNDSWFIAEWEVVWTGAGGKLRRGCAFFFLVCVSGHRLYENKSLTVNSQRRRQFYIMSPTASSPEPRLRYCFDLFPLRFLLSHPKWTAHFKTRLNPKIHSWPPSSNKLNPTSHWHRLVL